MSSATIAKDQLQVKRNPNDPRRDQNVIFFDKENIQKLHADTNQSGSAEFYQLVSMFIGIFAFMMKVKWAAWGSLFFFFTAVINMKIEGRFQQIFTGIGIIMVSFVSVYLQPPIPQQPITQAPQ
ncbi:UNKNOWN [Stylonychia lemnae]|uniref:Protein Asterix n=1 Tax=Stylonychia lemnae TaxID=5949 RepID=A0A078B8E1_STYLE|nr:UNKNOWN [Stylonychia lemnae]|eukprot:CDW90674.1 UNKNOWN [Stylonychia lemnae]